MEESIADSYGLSSTLAWPPWPRGATADPETAIGWRTAEDEAHPRQKEEIARHHCI